MMAAGILEHANFSVSDPQKTADMLCKIFDWRIRWRGEAIHGGHTIHVGGQDSYLAIYAQADMRKAAPNDYRTVGAMNHIGVVVGDLDAAEARVVEAGFEPKSHADYFVQEHGPAACGMAFRVKDSHAAYALALENGAQSIDIPTGPMEIRLPAIKGIGGAPLYLIDRYAEGHSIYDIDFEFYDGVDRHPEGCGFTVIDHLTHNVYRGRMKYWTDYYSSFDGGG